MRDWDGTHRDGDGVGRVDRVDRGILEYEGSRLGEGSSNGRAGVRDWDRVRMEGKVRVRVRVKEEGRLAGVQEGDVRVRVRVRVEERFAAEGRERGADLKAG